MAHSAIDRDSIHPLWLRLMHWTNALAVILMVMSGWRIYDATNFLHLRTPVVTGHGIFWQNGIASGYTLGGWLGGALQWHFAVMWVLVVNAFLYLIVAVALPRFKRQFFPVSVKGIFTDLLATVKGQLSH
ncbi:MAG: cytochrome b/b6 domain-containing protein, partial [Asticcacaulis sp.]